MWEGQRGLGDVQVVLHIAHCVQEDVWGGGCCRDIDELDKNSV